MPSSSPSLTAEQTETLRQLVYDRTGIWYADSKRYLLASRTEGHMADLGLDCFSEYMRAITVDIGSTAAFRCLCSRVTINETSFFRDAKQLAVFENRVLPELLKKRSDTRKLRLWSAACSTGEEPYTLAMILRRRLGASLGGWDVEILGTDLSEAALGVARTGVNTEYAVRSLDARQRASSFTQEPGVAGAGRFTLDPAVRGMVGFEHLNLADATGIARRGVWDVIFCRNVMIYFDEAARQRCLTSFRRVLAPDGTLFVGHSESLAARDDYQVRGESGAFAYSPRPTFAPNLSQPSEQRHVA